jgi:hypothetical protein
MFTHIAAYPRHLLVHLWRHATPMQWVKWVAMQCQLHWSVVVGGQWETHCAAGGGTVRPHDTAGASIPAMANAHRIRIRLRGAIADQEPIKVCTMCCCSGRRRLRGQCMHQWRKHEWDIFCDVDFLRHIFFCDFETHPFIHTSQWRTTSSLPWR